MGKKTKREIYKTLTRSFGDPTKLSERRKRQILTILGGWVGQNLDESFRLRLGFALNLSRRTADSTFYRPPLFTKHAIESRSQPGPNWHWKIDRKIMLPKKKILGAEKINRGDMSDFSPANTWDHIQKLDGKRIAVAFPVNYHLTVPPEIRVIGKKIVQKVWNHRVYTDKETWECYYWDFTKLGREESTWSQATWHEGFVVKMATSSAVEPTLSRAITMATGRTVRGSIRSILSDRESDA